MNTDATRCEFLAGCPFFNGDHALVQPAVIEHMKQRFCFKQPSTCARYQVRRACGPEAVPQDLTPNESRRAQDIILHSNI